MTTGEEETPVAKAPALPGLSAFVPGVVDGVRRGHRLFTSEMSDPSW